MHFEPQAIYHVYNRSNEKTFYIRDNYLLFLSKVRKLIFPFCDILAWVLMPNHFHFLIQAKESGCENAMEKHRPHLQILSKNFGSLMNGFTQAINKQEKRRGKLFSHDIKAKNLNEASFDAALVFKNSLCLKTDYATTCFLYIHQNPVMAGLVTDLEDWEYSSFRDYAGLRNGKLINKTLAKEIIELDFENLRQQLQFLVDKEKLKKIF